MKIDIAITYEHVNREYMMYQLLKLELERRGYSVKIFNNYRVDRWKTQFYNAKMMISGALRQESTLYSFKMIKNGTKVLNMQLEQIYGEDDNVADLNKPEGQNKNCYHVCWGEMSHQRMKRWGVAEEKILDVGPLQFDFLKKDLKSVYDSREIIANRYGLDTRKQWCLFASDAWFEKSEDTFFESHLEGYEGKVRDATKIAYRELLKMFDTMMKQNPNIEFIYRPHPSEEKRIEGISDLEKKYSHFHYIREESFQQWAVVIDKYFTWYSTSIVEAYIAGRAIYGIGDINPMKKIGANIKIIDEQKRILDGNILARIAGNECEDSALFALNKGEFDYIYTFGQNRYVYMDLCDKIEDIIHNGEGVCLEEDKQILYKGKNREYAKETFIHDVLYKLPQCFLLLLKKIKPNVYKSFNEFRKDFPEFEPQYRKRLEKRVREAYEKSKNKHNCTGI